MLYTRVGRSVFVALVLRTELLEDVVRESLSFCLVEKAVATSDHSGKEAGAPLDDEEHDEEGDPKEIDDGVHLGESALVGAKQLVKARGEEVHVVLCPLHLRKVLILVGEDL